LPSYCRCCVANRFKWGNGEMPATDRRRERLSFGGNVKRTLRSWCPAHCGMLVEVEDGRPVRFIGDSSIPVGAGKLCIKATPTLELHEHRDRLNHVLKRVGPRGGGQWDQISWDQAMDEIAAKLEDIRLRDGPEALALPGEVTNAASPPDRGRSSSSRHCWQTS